MPVPPKYTTTLKAGTTYFRITDPSFSLLPQADWARVVDGGPIGTRAPGRYNGQGLPTVYLTEDPDTCFSEAAYYFQKEIVRLLSIAHVNSNFIPPFDRDIVIWEILFTNDVDDLCDLNLPAATSGFGIFRSLLVSPTQDYEHLKDRRNAIAKASYNGLVAPSSRGTGNSVVLFSSQRANVRSIRPYGAKLWLIDRGGSDFLDHINDELGFGTCAACVTTTPLPAWSTAYRKRAKVGFKC